MLLTLAFCAFAYVYICHSDSQIFDYFADAKISYPLTSWNWYPQSWLPDSLCSPHTQQQCPTRSVWAASSVDPCHMLQNCSLPWREMTHEYGHCTAAYPQGSNMPGTNARLWSELMFIWPWKTGCTPWRVDIWPRIDMWIHACVAIFLVLSS